MDRTEESRGRHSPSTWSFRYTGNGMHITLLNDILFKVVFGTQRHSEALRGLLNAILGLQGADRIAEITLLNPLREKERLEDKARPSTSRPGTATEGSTTSKCRCRPRSLTASARSTMRPI